MLASGAGGGAVTAPDFDSAELRGARREEWPVECEEDPATCDCSWHENMRAAAAHNAELDREDQLGERLARLWIPDVTAGGQPGVPSGRALQGIGHSGRVVNVDRAAWNDGVLRLARAVRELPAAQRQRVEDRAIDCWPHADRLAQLVDDVETQGELVGRALGPTLVGRALGPTWVGLRDNRAQMTALAESFPSLRGRAGVRPWDPDVFTAPRAFGVLSSAGKHAARFVVSVWNSDRRVWPRRLGVFNVRDAFGTWDDDHRAAFTAWCSSPFFP